MKPISEIIPSSSSQGKISNQNAKLSKTSLRYWLKAIRGNNIESQPSHRVSSSNFSMRDTFSNQVRIADLRVPGPFGYKALVSVEEYITRKCTPAKRKAIENFAQVAGKKQTYTLLDMVLGNCQPQIQLLKDLYEKVSPEIFNKFLTEQFGGYILPISGVNSKLIPDALVDAFHKMDRFEYAMNIVYCSQTLKLEMNQLHDQVVNILIKNFDIQKTDFSTKYDKLYKLDDFISGLKFEITKKTQHDLESKLKELNSKSYIETSFSQEFLKYLDEQSPKHYAAAMSLLKYPSLNSIPLHVMQSALNTLSLSQMLYLFTAYPSSIKTQLECFTYQDPQLNQAKLFNLLNEAFVSQLGVKNNSISNYSTNVEFIQNLKKILIQKNQILMVKVFEKQYFPLLVYSQVTSIPQAFFSEFKGRWANMLALQSINNRLDENLYKIAHIWGIDTNSLELQRAKNRAKQRLEVITQLAYEQLADKSSDDLDSNTEISSKALLNAIISCVSDGSKDAAALTVDIGSRARHHLEFWQNLFEQYNTAVQKMPKDSNNNFEKEGQARALKFNSFLSAVNTLVKSQVNSNVIGYLSIPVLSQLELIKTLDVLEHALENIDFFEVQNINPDVDNLSLLIDQVLKENYWKNEEISKVISDLVPKLADKLLLKDDSNVAGLYGSRYQVGVDLKNAKNYEHKSLDLHEEITHYINTLYQLKNLPARIQNPQKRLEQLILPLVNAVKVLKIKPKGSLATALEDELKKTLSDLKLRVPQSVLATSLLIANGQDNGVEIQLIQNLQSLQHKQDSLIDTVVNILEGLLKIETDNKFAPLVVFARDYLSNSIMSTKTGSLAELKRKAEDRHSKLREVNVLLDRFKLLFSTESTDLNEIKNLFIQYKQIRDDKKNEKWVQDLITLKLAECRQTFIPPKDSEALKLWRNQYQSLLPLMTVAELSPEAFAPDDVMKTKGVNMKYLYSDQDIESLLNFSVNFDLKQSSKGQENPVTVAFSASELKDIRSKVYEWLKANNETVEVSKSKVTNRSREALLVIPFCPVDEKGESTNHWTGIVITQNSNGQLQTGYIDTLDAISSVPLNIKKAISSSIERYTQENKAAKLQFKIENELHIKHSQQRDITSCGSLLAHDMRIVIEKWQQTKVIPDVIATTKSAFDIRNQQIQEFGGMTSDFATRQMWNIHPVDSVNRQDFFTQDKLITSIVKSMKLMPEKRLEKFMQTLDASLIAPYLDFSTRMILFREKLSLTPIQIIDRSYAIYKEYEATQFSMAVLRQVSKSLAVNFEKVLNSIVTADNDQFDAAFAYNAIKSFLIKHHNDFGSAKQKEAILKGFFPQYDINKMQNLTELDLCSIEAIRIQKQISSMLFI